MLKHLFALLFFCLTMSLLSSPASSSEQVGSQTLLVLGDSLSAGYGVPEEQGWVSLLKGVWQAEQVPVQVINASVSGATTAAGLQRLPELIRQHHPKWMVLALGGNDGLQGKPLPYIKNNLESMIKQAQDQDVQVLLAGIRLPPNLGKRYTEPFYQQFADLVQQYQLAYIPFLLDGVAGSTQHMQSDGIHPTVLGHQVILDRVEPTLTRWVSQSK